MTPTVRIHNAKWAKHLLLNTAVIYFAKKLSGFARRRVRINVSLVPGLRHREHAKGMAHQNSPLSYQIRLDGGMKFLMLLRCLAHEMIHVNQWLTGKMEDIDGRTKVRWRRRIYSMPMRYDNHPWEKEAYRHDWRLAQSFINFWTR